MSKPVPKVLALCKDYNGHKNVLFMMKATDERITGEGWGSTRMPDGTTIADGYTKLADGKYTHRERIFAASGVTYRVHADWSLGVLSRCTNPAHDHLEWSGAEVPAHHAPDNAIPLDGECVRLRTAAAMTCHDCGKPTHWDEGVQTYVHDDPEAECFLHGPPRYEADATPCTPSLVDPTADPTAVREILAGAVREMQALIEVGFDDILACLTQGDYEAAAEALTQNAHIQHSATNTSKGDRLDDLATSVLLAGAAVPR